MAISSVDPRTRVYKQTINDLAGEKLLQARPIGTLEKDKNRITVLSSLSKGDRVDHFRFKVVGNLTNVSLSSRSNGLPADNIKGPAVRIQILDKQGRSVIADSAPSATGNQRTAYQDALIGELPLSEGQYIVRVTRSDGLLNSANPNYTFQLSAGKSKNDYDTKEYPALPASQLYPTTTPSIVNAITSLPPDGKAFTEVFSSDIGSALSLLI